MFQRYKKKKKKKKKKKEKRKSELHNPPNYFTSPLYHRMKINFYRSKQFYANFIALYFTPIHPIHARTRPIQAVTHDSRFRHPSRESSDIQKPAVRLYPDRVSRD